MRLFPFIFIATIFTTLKAQDKAPTNKHFWYTLETTAPPDAIWEIWTDVPNWKNWDTGLKDASIKGTFSLGAKGTITSLEDRRSKFKVVAFEEGRSYTYKTKLPLGSLYVKRYLKTENGTTTFTHEVWFKGLTSGAFANAFGEKFKKMLPNVLKNIKHSAESK